MRIKIFSFLTLIISLVMTRPLEGQSTQVPPLYDTIIALDKALFEAFNNCDLEEWKRYLAEDIEFYQDNDDVTTSRKELEPSFLDRCRKGNVATLSRELVLDSVEIYPIKGYGAVQLGTHHFWTMKNGKRDQLVARPKFVHLWRKRRGIWEITRVISYAH